MWRRVTGTLSIGLVVSAVMVATQPQLAWWCLILTIAQAVTFVVASTDDSRGWTVGLGLQPPWATYSVLSGQPAFLISTSLIAVANILALRRKTS